jgi:ankyrin repeat protein
MALNNNDHSPLLIAANSQVYNRNIVCIRMLDSLVTIPDRDLSALFHIIAQRTDIDGISRTLMQALLQRGFHSRFRLVHIPRCNPVNPDKKINCQSVNGLTLLHEATIACNSELIRLLIEQGILVVEEQDDNGNTPLHYAAQYDHTESHTVLGELLRLGANINALNGNNETALHIAVNRNCLSMVRRLVNQSGLDINTPNGRGDTALFAACRSAGKAALVECILAAPAEPEACLKNEQEQTPLHIAVTLQAGDEVIRALLNCRRVNTCAIRNQKDKKGKTALDIACESARHLLETTLVCAEHVSLDMGEVDEEMPDNGESEEAL